MFTNNSDTSIFLAEKRQPSKCASFYYGSDSGSAIPDGAGQGQSPSKGENAIPLACALECMYGTATQVVREPCM